MRKKFLNKDYQMYRLGDGDSKYHHYFYSFKRNLFIEFCKVSASDVNEIFGFHTFDVYEKLLERDYDIMFVTTQDKEHIIIGNGETEMVKFLEENVPLDIMKKCKRVNGLQSFGSHRVRYNANFDNNISYMYTKKYSNRIEKKV